ncbi:MAG: hypothetical protein J7K95_08025 [Thermoplasmata archaeon]|nr:hypothetical protein [Thermoplasmata archaeon]
MKIVHAMAHVTFIIAYAILILFSILFYNHMHFMFVLFLGWITLFFGMSIVFISIHYRKKSKGFVMEKTYSLIRHPEFFGHILIILSLIFISQNIYSIFIGTILLLLLYIAMIHEEKENIKKFGRCPFKGLKNKD